MDSQPDSADEQRVVVPGTRASMDGIQHAVLAQMQQLGWDEDACFAVRIALEEALANAVLHGHRGDESQPIEAAWCVTQDEVRLEVADEGRGFDPDAIPDPTADENLTLPSGRGLAMIRAFMDEVEVIAPGNRLIMCRARRG